MLLVRGREKGDDDDDVDEVLDGENGITRSLGKRTLLSLQRIISYYMDSKEGLNESGELTIFYTGDIEIDRIILGH